MADKIAKLFGIHALHAFLVFVGAATAGFFSYAMYAALAGPLGPSIAALLTGTSLLGLAGLIAGGLWWGLYRRRGGSTSRSSEGAEQLLAALLQDELAQKIRANPRESALSALAAGVILGASPQAREGLSEVLKSLLEAKGEGG